MCGICGELRFDGQPGDVNLVSNMRDVLKHRGPDDEGLWQSNFDGGSVALGHTRLAILDLTYSGHQPMWDLKKRYCIVYNGEVYNYHELRKALKKEGFLFKTKTDTEVVLNAYIKHGIDCLELFNGMYSFVVWDNKKKSLFCGRDRLGIKPFYYRWQGNRFYFASEIKALLLTSNGAPDPNPIAVYDYLSLGLMHHEQHTFFKDIHQLPAGSFLHLDSSGLSIQQYWHLSKESSGCQYHPDLNQLKTIVDDAVRLRLRSDVPVGILLSGGLDSSSITALAVCHNGASPTAFSLQFDNDDFDESIHAKMVAAHCNARLSLLNPQGHRLWQELDNLIKAQDAPTHAPEVYSNWCMMRAVARCNIKVLLSGQGGDELFAGYNWYPKHLLVSLFKKGKMFSLLQEFLRLPQNFPNNNTRKPLWLLASMLHALLPVTLKLKVKPEFSCMNDILQPQFRIDHQERDVLNLSLIDPAGLEEKLYNDLKCCNIPYYLHYEDANSMAFGIEERVPFLDHRLVEWAHRLVAWQKIRNGVSKYPLRSIMKGLLPEEVINRKDKMGLSAPRDQWFRNELRRPITDLFSDDCKIYEKWIDQRPFLDHLDAYMQGKPTRLSSVLWRVINLEKWLRLYT
ncbi:MAG: asparagine synthase (glutamine-hydrolyzing) [Desulfobacterales bacterium]|nr:MAG: asparagine synthase (glutamine-hydrolyzing) [Desulfobacterales bacterium]